MGTMSFRRGPPFGRLNALPEIFVQALEDVAKGYTLVVLDQSLPGVMLRNESDGFEWWL